MFLKNHILLVELVETAQLENNSFRKIGLKD